MGQGMAPQPSTSRPALLAAQLEGFGMQAGFASTVSAELVSRHPLAHRLGLPAFSKLLSAKGLAPSAAAEAARAIFALETFDLGGRLDHAMQELEAAGVSHGQALAAGLEGARIHRTGVRPGVDPSTEAELFALRFSLAVVAVALTIAWLQLR